MNSHFLKIACAAIALISTNKANASLLQKKEPAPQSCPDKACFKQGYALENCDGLSGYNLPAAVSLRNKMCDWPTTGFVDVSFIYYYASEEGLEVARSQFATTPTPAVVAPGVVLNQPFEYSPGFKIGLGVTHNKEWNFYGEYTYIRNTTHRTAGAPSVLPYTATGGNLGWLPIPWYRQTNVFPSSITSTWHLKVDLADFLASRPFYEGKTVTVQPYGGLRAAWISQDYKLISAAYPTPFAPTAKSTNSSHSWGLGPKMGVQSNCLLPKGFYVEGNVAESVLYTNYNVFHNEDVAIAANLGTNYKLNQLDYGTLRHMTEIGLGLGWGTYLRGLDYHVNVQASYDFNIFWSQNMMRPLVDYFATAAVSTSAYNLYLHGLTITAKLDF